LGGVYEPFQLASDDSIQQIRKTAASNEGQGDAVFCAVVCSCLHRCPI
jgi:hypothetical protein